MSKCLSDTYIKSTRKSHICECCNQIHPPGSEMFSYAGTFEGEFYHFYYCLTCAELHDILNWDWSEGILGADEELVESGVISSIKCPFYEAAIEEMEERERNYNYFKRDAQCFETEIVPFGPYDCENRPEEHCRDWNADYRTRKITFECDCITEERRTWAAGMMEAARTAASEWKKTEVVL